MRAHLLLVAALRIRVDAKVGLCDKFHDVGNGCALLVALTSTPLVHTPRCSGRRGVRRRQAIPTVRRGRGRRRVDVCAGEGDRRSAVRQHAAAAAAHRRGGAPCVETSQNDEILNYHSNQD